MKRVNALKTGIMAVVMFASVAAWPQQSARDYQSKIEDLNKEMTKFMLEGNWEKGMSYYTDDAISLPSYEPMREGLAEIRKSSEEMSKKGMKINSYEPTTVKVIPDGNLITEIGTYKINITMPGMDKAVDDHGKYLTIWEKQPDGTLKVKVETWNSDVNPMSQMEQK